MANPGISKAVAEQAVKTVQQCIDEGFLLIGSPNAVQESARRLEIPDGTVYSRLKAAKKKFKIEPVSRDPTELPVPTSAVSADPIEVRRLRDQVRKLTIERDTAQRIAIEAQDIRTGVLGLVGDPLKPRLDLSKSQDTGHDGRTVILHLSDVHYGETISLEEMDGANRYDVELAQVRIGRFFRKAASLMTEYWRGDAPEEIILCLGGDLISGDIHPELAQTNAPSVPATVREVGEHIAGGVVHLRQKVKCPVRVYSVPGNHGRLTHKPQSKGRAAGSLDLLATDFAEATLRGTKTDGVTFYRSASPDALFSTYAWHWILTHGDTMGAKGGTGYIGPLAAIIKGHRKLVDTSWRSGRPVHFVLTGHFHTTGKTTFGWSNGSVCGFSEYARDLRCDPEPARQTMLVVHPRNGIIDEKPLYLGHPSEGSLYAGPASLVRPPVSRMNDGAQ